MSTLWDVATQSAYAPAVDTLLYTVPANTRVSIDKCTSFSVAGGTLTLYIVESGGSVGAPKIMAVNTLAANSAYTWPEMVGHYMNPGDTIWEKAATVSTVSRRISIRKAT